MRPFIAGIVMAALAGPVVAQKLVESIEVHVVNVDVVVTDRSGKPVTGLTKDDFELFENGKAQPLTNFYEVRAEPPAVTAEASVVNPAERATAPPAEMSARRFIIFVDNYSLHPFKRNQVFDSLVRFVDDHMRDRDEATLVVWNRRPKVVLPFTSDKAALRSAVAAEKKRGTTALTLDFDVANVKRQCLATAGIASRGRLTPPSFDTCHSMISAFADATWAGERALIEAIRMTMVSAAGMEGKKVLVLSSAYLPENPGLELFEWLQREVSGGAGMQPRFDAAQRSQTLSIEKLAREANADGVTFYVIDTADSRDAIGADQSEQSDPIEAFDSYTNTSMAFQSMARLTGGVAVTNTNNFELAFQTIARDLDFYYSLGYKPADERSGDRRIVVKAKNPAFTVRSRQTHAVKSGDEQVSDRVLANIAHEGMKSDWPFEVRVGTPARSGRFYNVPVELAIAPTLTLLPEGDKLVGGFTVYLAVGSDEGMSDVSKSRQTMRIPAVAEAAIRSRPLIFNAVLQVRGGESTLSVAVVDTISNTAGFQRARIVTR
jgi:VWFA-related protein